MNPSQESQVSHSVVVITLERFSESGKCISEFLGADLVLYHEDVFEAAFPKYHVLVAVMSSGIAIRKIAPFLTDKWHDPALVIVTPDMKYAIPVLGGHHGANEVAERLEELDIIPIISTATETKGLLSVEKVAQMHDAFIVNRDSTRAVNGAILDGAMMKERGGEFRDGRSDGRGDRSDAICAGDDSVVSESERNTSSLSPPLVHVHPPAIVLAMPGVSVLVTASPYIMGIGCRRGTSKEEIEEAIDAGCKQAGISPSAITTYVTTVQKLHETGLHEAVRNRGSLVFLDDKTMNAQQARIASSSQAIRLGLCGVSEPACLALSAYGELVLEKQIYGRVTIAISR